MPSNCFCLKHPSLPAKPDSGDVRNNPIVQVGRGPLAAKFGAKLPLALIAGPCQIESRAHAFETASALKEIAARRGDRARL